VNRGAEGAMMYALLWALQDLAPKAGGEVVLLVGNHELMLLNGDLRFATPRETCFYTGAHVRDACHRLAHAWELWTNPTKTLLALNKYHCHGFFMEHTRAAQASSWVSPSSWIYGLLGRKDTSSKDAEMCCTGAFACGNLEEWFQDLGMREMRDAWKHTGFMGAEFFRRVFAGQMKLAHEIDGKVFVHAGLTTEFMALFPDIEQATGQTPLQALNSDFALQLNRAYMSHEPESRAMHPTALGDDVPSPHEEYFEMLFEVDNSPVWTRQCEAADACPEVAAALSHVGGEYLIIGHCPHKDLVLQACNGTFVMMDTAMSVAFNRWSRERADRHRAALEFRQGEVPEILRLGHKTSQRVALADLPEA